MCGEFMQLEERKAVAAIPGTAQVVTRTTREWVCPECDYFEEAEPEEKTG